MTEPAKDLEGFRRYLLDQANEAECEADFQARDGSELLAASAQVRAAIYRELAAVIDRCQRTAREHEEQPTS